MLDLSVIIINYNSLEETKNCIHSVRDYIQNLSYEIIVADNFSFDKERILELKNKETEVIIHDRNLGFGKAVNYSANIAKGEFLLIINPDASLLDHSIVKILDYLRSHQSERYYCGAPIMVDHFGKPVANYWLGNKVTGILSSLRKGMEINPVLLRICNRLFSRTQKDGIIGGLYGALIVINKEKFLQLGGFDPDFFMYCEDTEFFRNRYNEKFKTYIHKEGKFLHKGGMSTPSDRWKFSQNYLSYILYWYKLGMLRYVSYGIGFTLASLFNILIVPFLSNASRSDKLDLLKLMPFLFWKIPKYSNKYGSRPQPLKLE